MNNSILNESSENSKLPDLPKTVESIGQINFVGNIIPHTWYHHLKYENGKPYINAIIILSELVYWYRPVPVKDEITGMLLGYRKKFKDDKLQRSRKSLAKQFGFSERQVRSVLKYLEEKKLITREYREIETKDGRKMTNIPFIDLISENIKKLNNLPPTPKKGGDFYVTPPLHRSHPPRDIEVTLHEIPNSKTTKESGKKTHESMEHHHESQGAPTAKQKNDDDVFKLMNLGLDKLGATALVKKLKTPTDLIKIWFTAKQANLIPENWGPGKIYEDIKEKYLPPLPGYTTVLLSDNQALEAIKYWMIRGKIYSDADLADNDMRSNQRLEAGEAENK